MKKVTLAVKGMYCSHCSKAVENALSHAGVLSNVNLSNNTVTFTYDETKISLDYLKRLVKRAGYEHLYKKRRFYRLGNLRQQSKEIGIPFKGCRG